MATHAPRRTNYKYNPNTLKTRAAGTHSEAYLAVDTQYDVGDVGQGLHVDTPRER